MGARRIALNILHAHSQSDPTGYMPQPAPSSMVARLLPGVMISHRCVPNADVGDASTSEVHIAKHAPELVIGQKA